jgi:hypothetical protein
VFSGTIAYGAPLTGDNIRILGYEGAPTNIFEGDSIQLEIKIENKSEDALKDLYVDIDQSSDFYGDPAYTNFYVNGTLGATGTLEATGTLSNKNNRLVYKGSGNTLKLNFKYKIDDGAGGKDEYTESHTLYISEAVPTGTSAPSTPTDTSKYEPRLTTDSTGKMPIINAGTSYKLKYTIKNLSIYQARNVRVTMKMADTAKAPQVMQNFELWQTLATIDGNKSADVIFDININSTAPDGIYAITLTYEYDNAYGNHFSPTTETVYIRVVNDNTSPKLIVDNISVKQSQSASDAIILELKIANLGSLRADDVKVTLGGLRSGGFTAYNSTDVRYIDKVYGNGSATVSYELLPPSSGAAGSNELTVKFEYKDSAGNSYTEQNQIFVPAGEGEGTRPNIAFEKITAPQEALGVGKEFGVSFSLNNNGGAPARNIKVSLSTDAGIVIRSMNPVYLTDLGANKSERISYTLYAADEAVTKNYPISLNVEYEDVYGTKYTATQYIGVFVENDAGKTVPRIIIDNYSLDPFPVNAGEDVKLKMSFLNTSKTVDVSNIKVTVSSDDGTFTPTDSGNTFYIESIPRTQNVERELMLHAKPDAEQKSYVLTVTFEYEDEKGNPYTAKETMSVRVLQSPRLMTGQISMMTETFVGQPVSLYLDFYNMGKSTLYNLMVSIEGDFEGQGLNYYVGNFEPGRTDYFDVSFSAMNPGMQKGNVLFTFEDANGKISEIRKEFDLNVMEMMMPDTTTDEFGNPIDMGIGKPGMDFPGMPGQPSKVSIWIYIGIGAAVLAAAVVVFIILRKRHIRRKDLSLDD